MRYLSVMLMLVSLSGCTASDQAVSALASGAGGFLANHIQAVNVSYNPGTGDYTGALVFKDGRWQRATTVGLVAMARAECDPVTRGVREASPCEEHRSFGGVRAVDVYELRAAINGGGGLRNLVGPLVSTRTVNREVVALARDAQRSECDTFKALKEIHEAEEKRLGSIILATNPSMLGSIRRLVRGTPCITPTAVQTSVAPQAPIIYPEPTLNTIPEPGNDGGLGSGSIPPPARSISNLENRVAALESAQKGCQERLNSVDSKLDAILKAVKKE